MKIENIFYKQEKININTLDIYQIRIINLYHEAINIPRIRQMIHFICYGKGYASKIKKQHGKFYVQFEHDSAGRGYQSYIIFMVKKIIEYYHKKEVIKLYPLGQWWKVHATFDCSTLSHEERGLLTKILKEENKRLKFLGIKNRREKKRYMRKVYEFLN